MDELRDKLRGDVLKTGPDELLPHHRRGALLLLEPSTDLLDVAVAIAGNQADTVANCLDRGILYKPSLSEMADHCVDRKRRFQCLILQPYVVAQLLASVPKPAGSA